MARVVARGEIGEPRLATFLLHIPMLADPAGEVPAWWGTAAEGGGWLGAQAAHVIDQVRVMLGEIEGVSASLTQVSARDWDVEDAYTVHFRTRSGVAGVMQSTSGAYGPPVFVTRVAGTRGTVWDEFGTVRVADADGTREIPPPNDLPPSFPRRPADLLTTRTTTCTFGIDLAVHAAVHDVPRSHRWPPGSRRPAGDVCRRVVSKAGCHPRARTRCWVEIEQPISTGPSRWRSCTCRPAARR
jgi:predicted dehydrogenase